MSFKIERIRANKKAEEVAAFMGVSVTAISCWENGRYLPMVDKLQRLAEYYGCTTDALLEGNPVKQSEKKVAKNATGSV